MVQRADNMNEMEGNIEVQYSSEDDNLGREMQLFYLMNSVETALQFFNRETALWNAKKPYQTDIQTDKQTDTRTYRQTDRHIQTDTQTERYPDRQTDKQETTKNTFQVRRIYLCFYYLPLSLSQ